MKTKCILQARISSSRLWGKVLLPGYDKPLLLHIVERLKKSKLLDDVIVATSFEKIDDIIYNICKKHKISVFRGHHTNLLNRYYQCAKKFKIDTVVRITSDCPLIDSRLIDKIIVFFNTKKGIDYVSNIHPATFPDGYDVEVFNFKSLKKSFFEAKKNFEREHVTPYIWENSDKFVIKNYSNLRDINLHKKYRLTLDYIEDYYVIFKIYQKIYPKKKNFDLKDVLNYLKSNPKILVNKKYLGVNWYRHHLTKLKTIKKSDTNLKYF